MELPWVAGGVLRALVGPPMHRHCIIGSWLSPKDDSLASTCEDLVQMAVPKLVDGLQGDDNGSMDSQ